jgi:MtaA/CmuA family methyltransferase
MNGRERILCCLKDEAIDCLPYMPITMMFAADQIGVKYLNYVTDYRILVEGQLVTAEKFDFDYVSCISDPAREAADCGAAVKYFPNQPPALLDNEALLIKKGTLKRLKLPSPHGGGRMHDRIKATALFKEKVGGELLIEGWIEGPCSLASNLRGIQAFMLDFYEDPLFVRDLLDFTIEVGQKFARAQKEAGADLIGIGDAACSLVGPKIYKSFIWPYQKSLISSIHKMGLPVRLHICGNTDHILKEIAELQCEIVDLDYPVSLSQARTEMGPDQILLGNINPLSPLRNGTPEAVTEAVTECHQQAGSRYIVGAGCEVTRDTPPMNLMALRDYARTH